MECGGWPPLYGRTPPKASSVARGYPAFACRSLNPSSPRSLCSYLRALCVKLFLPLPQKTKTARAPETPDSCLLIPDPWSPVPDLLLHPIPFTLLPLVPCPARPDTSRSSAPNCRPPCG